MQDRFQVLPDEMLCHIFSFLSADDLLNLQFVIKKWKYIVDELLYQPDLITSLCENLSLQGVKDVIAEYKNTLAYQFVSSISAPKRNVWQILTCHIAEEKADDLPLLAKAFFTMASRLPAAALGKFITNFRATSICKALVNLPDNQMNNLQRLCHALLCDTVKRINPDQLQTTLVWAENQFLLNEYQLLLRGIKVTLRVRQGNKKLPVKPTYYINLRGADLSRADLTNSDFSSGYVDFSGSKLSSAKFSHDKWVSQYILSHIGTFTFCYIRDKFIDMTQVGLPVRIMLGIIGSMLSLKWFLQSNFTDYSNLSCIDLRNANLCCTEIGGCNIEGAQLTGSNLNSANDLCYINMKEAVLLDENAADNVNDILTRLIEISHIPQIRNIVTNNIIVTAENLPKPKGIALLEAAIAHPFFTIKSPSFRTWAGTGLPVSQYALSFFRRVPDYMDSLKKALEELQNQPENAPKSRGLKRKFTVL